MSDKTAEPAAWMHPDGRVVPAATKDAADRDGGGMRSSLTGYTIPLSGPDALVAQREKHIRALSKLLDRTVVSKYSSVAECEAARAALRNAMREVLGA